MDSLDLGSVGKGTRSPTGSVRAEDEELQLRERRPEPGRGDAAARYGQNNGEGPGMGTEEATFETLEELLGTASDQELGQARRVAHPVGQVGTPRSGAERPLRPAEHDLPEVPRWDTGADSATVSKERYEELMRAESASGTEEVGVGNGELGAPRPQNCNLGRKKLAQEELPVRKYQKELSTRTRRAATRCTSTTTTSGPTLLRAWRRS